MEEIVERVMGVQRGKFKGMLVFDCGNCFSGVLGAEGVS